MDVHIDTKIGMMLVVAFLIGGALGGGIGAFAGHGVREHGDRDMRDMMDGRFAEEQGEGIRVEKVPNRTVHNMMQNQMPPQTTASTSNSALKESINPNTATSPINTGV